MPDLDRRRFFGAAAATFAASQLGLLAFSRRLEAMTQPITEVPTQTSSARSDIRPFRVSFPEEQLTDLRRRQSDKMAREGDRRRRYAGCAAGDDAGAGELLGG